MKQSEFRPNSLAIIKWLREDGAKGTIIANGYFFTIIGVGKLYPKAHNDNEAKP